MKHKFLSMKNWGFVVVITVLIIAIFEKAINGYALVAGIDAALWVLCHYNVKAKEYNKKNGKRR